MANTMRRAFSRQGQASSPDLDELEPVLPKFVLALSAAVSIPAALTTFVDGAIGWIVYAAAGATLFAAAVLAESRSRAAVKLLRVSRFPAAAVWVSVSGFVGPGDEFAMLTLWAMAVWSWIVLSGHSRGSMSDDEVNAPASSDPDVLREGWIEDLPSGMVLAPDR